MNLPPPTSRFTMGTLHQVHWRSGMSAKAAGAGAGLGEPALGSGGFFEDSAMERILSAGFALCQWRLQT